ncbi:MAG: hypothetical protein SOV85_04360 [Clostridium sp.]|uniref:hypothetical protein n=1 Tax=Clostridium sp. TaxID=1506 RepID=UPI00280B78CC|nr:hypothetical protein [Clostridium sp.]MDY2630569.1 hypothetical protein [Clostridium sp.]
MKKIISIFIIFILLIITGCLNKNINQYNYSYKGKNEFWTAEYHITGNDTTCEKIFTITYNYDISQLSSIKRLEISYESSVANGGIEEIVQPEKSYTLKSTTSGGVIESKDEVIKVTINIDGHIQILELKN